jgi:Zn-dependent M28 family amino/carboxypeptidase
VRASLVGRAFVGCALSACATPPPPPETAPPPLPPPALAPPVPPPRPAVAGRHAEALRPLLDAVRPARMTADVAKLAGFGTRHTLSPATSSSRGIGAARAYIASELSRVPGVTTSFERVVVPADGKRISHDTEIVNVVGVLPGAMPEAAARRYYVVGHYDSRASDVMDVASDAPGANDDASGVAVVLELARVLAGRRLDATVVFLATAGEEQSLFGAKEHARRAREQGLDVRAVLNDDIVGDPSDPRGGRHDRSIRVFSGGIPPGATPEQIAEIRKLGAENDSGSRELSRFIAEVARDDRLELVPRQVFRQDRFLRGGDQLAFLEAGFPAAVRFTTVAETYARQHQNVRVENGVKFGDLPEFVDREYLARVARLEAAVLTHLASAPSAPPHAFVDAMALENDSLLHWEASPEPDVAGYEVVWRDTSENAWTHAEDVGQKLEAHLPASKDDVIFGVRARDRDGWKSPATLARVMTPR